MADLVRCEVIGEFGIVDAVTGASVLKPGVVELDPAYTNIPALEQAGLVKVLPPPQPKPKRGKGSGWAD